METQLNEPADDAGNTTQLPLQSEEWKKLTDSIIGMEQGFAARLAETLKTMQDWEARLLERERQADDLKRRYFARMKEYDPQWKSKLEEKEQDITRLKSACNDKARHIDELNKELGGALALVEKIKGLADGTRLNLETDEPETVAQALWARIGECQSLKDELARKSDYDEIKNAKERLEKEKGALKTSNEQLVKNATDTTILTGEIVTLQEEKRSLKALLDAKELQQKALQDELDKLKNLYRHGADREARVNSIETPFFSFASSPGKVVEENETKWLEGIVKGCRENGYIFPERLLYSFHTALKTAEWSPITVLAGVSGTGKSKLPELYSRFGGINFLSLPVQSNWDSQESMLGFFNTVENCFEAQPVLRLLAQSQREWSEDKFGLQEYMTMVLLDEMNLAHVELYFSDFLSKLELRRGRADDDVPCLDVKLGANIPPYDLHLGRNVLWVGTMNQDETTKSLSDKVLDRSIVINFPRPTELGSRSGAAVLPKTDLLLPRATWRKWVGDTRQLDDEKLKPYKEKVEKINSCLGDVGRAIGHRVWQSIQNYMMSYPSVPGDKGGEEYALNTAFEDQLVQKVMPKLRGIETTGGKGKKCLDSIGKILEGVNNGSLAKDFNLARESGYGQFIWNSAHYLTGGGEQAERES